MCGALQGAEVRKDLLQADARERKYQCHSSGKTTAGDMGILCCQKASSREPNVFSGPRSMSVERLEPALTPQADRQGMCLSVIPVDQLHRRGPRLKKLCPTARARAGEA